MCYYGSLLVAPPDRADDSICPLPHHHTLSALLLANRIKALIFILKSKYCKDMSDEGYKMGIKIANVPQNKIQCIKTISVPSTGKLSVVVILAHLKMHSI